VKKPYQEFKNVEIENKQRFEKLLESTKGSRTAGK